MNRLAQPRINFRSIAYERSERLADVVADHEVGDIILFDPTAYLAIDKGQMQQASSIHVRFIYDETCFRFVYRFNGQPKWRTARTPYKGSNSQSPFVTLQAR